MGRYRVQDYFWTGCRDMDARSQTPSLLAKHTEGLQSGRTDCGGWSHEKCVLRGHAWANARSLQKGSVLQKCTGRCVLPASSALDLQSSQCLGIGSGTHRLSLVL